MYDCHCFQDLVHWKERPKRLVLSRAERGWEGTRCCIRNVLFFLRDGEVSRRGSNTASRQQSVMAEDEDVGTVLRVFDFSTALPYRPFPWLGYGIYEEETRHESLREVSLFHRQGVLR